MKTLLTPKKLTLWIVLLLVFVIATPVLAHYTGGPNRTVTITEYGVCHWVEKRCGQRDDGTWHYTNRDSVRCSSESKPWLGGDSCGSCNEGNDGHTCWEKTSKDVTTTVNQPPATIRRTLENCTERNGWCISRGANLALSATEPLPGHSITVIEGTLNTSNFSPACADGATSCTVFLVEGENDFEYWAHSTRGDTTELGTDEFWMDTVPPVASLDIVGTPGMNGWYVSDTTVTAVGSDDPPGSGVVSQELTIDAGANWYASLTLVEGVYDVTVSVLDDAWHETQIAEVVAVDTTPPSISPSFTGTAGNNGWYTSTIQALANAEDVTSGIATFEVSLDGAAYQAYTALSPLTLMDGYRTIRFRAVDVAGNMTETPIQEFYVDTVAPKVNLPNYWKLGQDVKYAATDTGSGLNALRVVIEDEDEKYDKVAWDRDASGTSYDSHIDWNGEFRDKTVAPPGTYLVWIKASDRAGNEHFELGQVTVPQPPGLFNPFPTEVPTLPAELPAPPAELFDSGVDTSAGSGLTSDPSGGASGSDSASSSGNSTLTGGSTSGSIDAGGNGATGGLPGAGTLPSLPWLPIAAAAALGASAVVASGVLTRKEEEDSPAQQFHTNPIPASLFPGSAGGTKAIPSPRRDDPPPQGSGAGGASNKPKDPPPQPKKDPPLWVQVGGGAADYILNADSLAGETLEEVAGNAQQRAINGDLAVAEHEYNVAAAENNLHQAEANRAAAAQDVRNAEVQQSRANAFANSDAPGVQAAAPGTLKQTAADLQAAQAELDGRTLAAEVARREAEAAQAALDEARGARAIAYDDTAKAVGNVVTANSLPASVQHLSANLDTLDNVFDTGGLGAAGLSIAGTVLEAAGIKDGQMYSDAGNVLGFFSDLGSLGSGMTRLLSSARSMPLPPVSWLAKAGAVLAIPVGGYTMVTEGAKFVGDLADGGEFTQEGQIAGVNALGGFLTMAGGVAMLIPGGQLVGAILLAAGGVASGIAWYMENKDRVNAWVSNAAQTVSTAVSNAWNNTTGAISGLWNTLTNPPVDPVAPLGSLGSGIVSLTPTVAKAVDTASKAVNAAKETAKNVVNAAKNTAKNVVNAAKNTAKNVVNAAKETVKNVATTVKNTVNKAVTTVKNAVNNAVTTVKNTVKNVTTTVKNTVNKAVTTVKNTVNNAVTTVKNTVAKATQTVAKATQTVTKAVSNVTQKAASTVKSIGNTISNWFKKKP